MFPEPLHPSVVHFPLVLAVFLPVIAAVVLWRIHDGARLRTWGIVALVAVLTWGSGYVAVRTGEDEEERVEDVLGSHEPIHEHEEAAEFFLLVSGITAGLAILGFAPGLAGRGLRILTLVGTVAAAAASVRVGKLGGELVYQHGAAAAYTSGTMPAAVPDSMPEGGEHDHEEEP